MEEIKAKKIHVVRDLSANEEALQGLASQGYGERYAEQRQRAERNIQKAKELKERIRELESRRGETNELLERANQKHREWMEVESEMYRAIQPFSMPALQANLDYATSEAESLSETLAASFLDGHDITSDAGVNEFIRNYRKERKTYHLRHERLQRWKEERVGRA
ncbi:hypothetical protein TRICI_002870 [Trichomonascus ciferrii]|uniref:VPS37 C-terminal domain-containing protein n=1 Tax=Trichomonascus ciferrii TaxID=44093 RepID=A0A642V5P9_9ASCO|nr:hypothetical protein TRICI_002870 [Trichomonascus ciferrii]